jgi:hypothetical protein
MTMDQTPNTGTGSNDETTAHDAASDATSGSTGASDESFGWTGTTEPAAGSDTRATAERMLGQLQGMIDNLATQAAPVARQIGAKAAELAAVAADRAGPLAHKAAEVTADASVKLAERSRTWAADLRRNEGEGSESAGSTDGGADPAFGTSFDASAPSTTPSHDDPVEGRRDIPTE